MTGDLRELYQEVILDHNKHPRNYRTIEPADRQAEGFNPLCGDRVTVFLTLDSGRIADVAFQGSGCAISTASASMMTEQLKGKTPEEALLLFREFHDLVTGKMEEAPPGLGKLAIFTGVREFPIRVKCASLAWHTVKAALEGERQPVSTE
jgi:nitrogen fixation protein NifU and related proteins